jgi:myo-inositol catabolism protein IolS
MTLLKNIQNIPLSFGGAAISGEGAGYGFGTISDNESIDLLHLAFENGFRIFDTAPIYGFGLSEKRMGMAFRQNRDKVFIVSKSGVTWHENRRVDMTNRPEVAQKMLEQSLRDLNSDYIDLYMIHWPDNNVDIRKTMEVLSKARHEGKIKHIGLCNSYVEDIKKASEVDKIEVLQSQFNFFDVTAKRDLFDFAKNEKMSFMSWGTFDKGILTGRVDEKRKFDESDCRSWAPWWKSQDFKSKFEVMKKLKNIVNEHQFTLTEFALGYNLSNEELTNCICGARNQEQLLDIVKSLSHLPTKEQVESIISNL